MSVCLFVFGRQDLYAELPSAAHTTYFRDEIGNVSSSAVRAGVDKTLAVLQPRYPLFGGWAVDFIFGYSLPLKKFAFKRNDGKLQVRCCHLVLDCATARLSVCPGASPFKKLCLTTWRDGSLQVVNTFGPSLRGIIVEDFTNKVCAVDQGTGLVARFFPWMIGVVVWGMAEVLGSPG
jgi:Ribophorin I